MANLIGQILIKNGILTAWQVDKILEHQKLSRQRFGQIAVSWGWAQPQDVWQAWADQIASGCQTVDLDEVGVDTAATEKVPPGVAWHYRAVAIRTWGDHLVLAVPEHMVDIAREELPALLGENLYFCKADRQQIDRILDRVYTLAMM